MILVLGATGAMGSEICQLIREKGLDVRAMVRHTSNPEKIQLLKDLGVKTVQGDIREPASFNRVLTGISTIISTATSVSSSFDAVTNNIENVDHRGMIDFLTHAQSMDTRRIIYTSFSGNVDRKFPLYTAKRSVEQYIMKSGLIYTILRPSFFMETWLSAATGFDFENGRANIYGDGKKKISYVSYHDVAHFAVESLTNPYARKSILEIGGPKAISQLEAVHIFEKINGREIETQFIPKEIMEQKIATAANDRDRSFAALMWCLAQGDEIDMTDLMGKFMEKLTKVEEYARNVMHVPMQ